MDNHFGVIEFLLGTPQTQNIADRVGKTPYQY
jgi:hypothetical protein